MTVHSIWKVANLGDRPACDFDAPECEGENKLVVNKITWAQIGRVTEPRRYMFTFGWLTITADDLAIWTQYPTAAFTLYSTGTTRPPGDETEKDEGEEFRHGTFELSANSSYSGESEQ